MPGRIITLQRQARELGRLRAGTFETPTNGRGRPVRSRTWILTAHQRAYLGAGAEEWGGTVEQWTPQGSTTPAWRLITDAEAVDAILPPGDPLFQSYEMWSRGGCQRRCDGEVEQLTSRPCLCRAAFGDEFHLRPPEEACRPHTRLNVILPQMPDLGVWRMESKGFYAANEIAAAVDLIRHATGGSVAVPIRLRIEPRQRVAQGKTKKYPVIVVEIRGATAGQIMSGQAPTIALDAAPQRAAIAAQAAPSAGERDWLAEIRAVDTAVALNALREQMQTAGVRDAGLVDAWKQRGAEIVRAAQAGQAKAVEPEPDADEVWTAIVAAAPAEWGMSGLEQRVCELLNKSSDEADGFELQRFLTALKNGEIR